MKTRAAEDIDVQSTREQPVTPAARLPLASLGRVRARPRWRCLAKRPPPPSTLPPLSVLSGLACDEDAGMLAEMDRTVEELNRGLSQFLSATVLVPLALIAFALIASATAMMPCSSCGRPKPPPPPPQAQWVFAEELILHPSSARAAHSA